MNENLQKSPAIQPEQFTESSPCLAGRCRNGVTGSHFNLMQGDVTFAPDRFNFSVPADFGFGDRKYSIIVSASTGGERVDVTYSVQGRDRSSLNIIFSAIPVMTEGREASPGTMLGEFDVLIAATGQSGDKAEQRVTFCPAAELNDAVIQGLQAILDILQGTDAGAFVVASSMMGYGKKPDPVSILNDPGQLFAPTFGAAGLETAGLLLTNAGTITKSKPGLGKVIWICGLRLTSIVLVCIAGASSGVGVGVCLVNAGIQGTLCAELLEGYVDP